MRHLASVLSLSLLLTTLGARADLAVGPFSAVMTSPAMPSRRALIVTPAFLDDRVNARAAPARQAPPEPTPRGDARCPTP